jgi:hypothetical protein
MFCNNCGTEYGEGINYCSKCGNPISPVKKTIESEPTIRYQESGRGTLILILGLLSFIFGPFCGIPAWVMGSGDLTKIKRGIIDISEKTATKIGMIFGIITTLLIPFIIIFGIATVVGINVFTASSTQANRDAVVADLTNLTSLSQQYYRKPLALGGGGNSFINWEIPEVIKSTGNGEYSVEDIQRNSLTIIGVGIEKGNDGENKIKVIMKIAPERILSTQIVN